MVKSSKKLKSEAGVVRHLNRPGQRKIIIVIIIIIIINNVYVIMVVLYAARPPYNVKSD